MQNWNQAWYGCCLLIAAVALWFTGEDTEARRGGAARGGGRATRSTTSRSHGSVRHASKSVTRTGAHSGSVTRSATVATPRGTKSATRTTTVGHGAHAGSVRHGGAHIQPVHHRREVHDDLHDAARRARVRHAVGHIVRTPPHGYTHIYVHGVPYYYYDGVYYVKSYSEETVVYVVEEPPVDAVIYVLPDDYEEMVVKRKTYFTDGTVYYVRVYRDDRVGYVVVKKP